ncbi:hypothetical protein BC938DRAFT_483419 [Jimgerdemannia flammicorona]|uniref:BAR domain-containing protein n=1 Tax=Jimgerdemannia flammicorona TaxID=994334 RepID=A0A433QVT8_9FUNG|nr:hypothetical protein BC938DRAFT_483419 [Jimgerdemannia flammicorona]
MTVPAVSLPTNIITVQDAVSDTPAFRSNVEHFEDQVELLERWLENLVRSLKHYSEELSSECVCSYHGFQPFN